MFNVVSLYVGIVPHICILQREWIVKIKTFRSRKPRREIHLHKNKKSLVITEKFFTDHSIGLNNTLGTDLLDLLYI